MSSFDDFIPPHVRSLGGYVPGKSIKAAEKESGVRCIKMASNENPYGPSPAAMAAMQDAALNQNLYPDDTNTDLRVRLAELHGVSADEVLVTDGSTSFLDVIARTLLRPGLNAVTSERSFIVYPLVTRIAGGALIEAAMRGDCFDLDAILAAINGDTRIVYIANPNNPTGTLLEAAAIDAFLARVPEHVLVVLDEAYSDFAAYFAEREGRVYTRSIDYVREGRNVVVLRTFSKAHGLAGVRVGYGFAARNVIQYFARVRTPFSVSGIAEAAALAALDDREHVRRAVLNNAAGIASLTQSLRGIGLRVVPSSANFLYFEVPEDSAAVAKRMQSEGIIVRPLGPWGCPNAIRVSVGTPEQNEKFLAALKHALERVAAV